VERKREALAEGLGEPVEWVFHRHGRPWAQNSVRYYFKRILRKAGLRDMRFHDIRHTFASLLLSNGESPVYVKEQLGHSSIQITVDIYGHPDPQRQSGRGQSAGPGRARRRPTRAHQKRKRRNHLGPRRFYLAWCRRGETVSEV
jgi:integrase